MQEAGNHRLLLLHLHSAVTYENLTYFLCRTVEEYNNDIDDVIQFYDSHIISLRHGSIVRCRYTQHLVGRVVKS